MKKQKLGGKKPKTASLTPAEQSARFIEAAKKAEADESGENFEKAVSKIARAKPAARHSHPSSKRSSS